MLKNQQPPTRPGGARPWLLLGVWTAAALAADLASKQWAWDHLRPPAGRPWIVWDSLLELQFAYNRGSAFGVVRELGALPVLVISAVMLAWVAMMVRAPGGTHLRHAGCGLVVGGALGNLHDRLLRVDAAGHHGVVDFIRVHLPWGAWPSFNVADATLVVGAVLLAWSLREPR